MKKVFVAITMLIASASIFSFTAKTTADVYTVNVAKSKVEWRGATNDHYQPGTLNLKSGSVTVDNGKITGGTFVFDLATIKVSSDAGERLENHLKSADFFDIAKFGEATYEITSVHYTSDNVAEISGNLGIKGISVPVKLTGKIRGLKDGKLFAQAYFSLDSAPFSKKPMGVDIAVHLFANK